MWSQPRRFPERISRFAGGLCPHFAHMDGLLSHTSGFPSIFLGPARVVGVSSFVHHIITRIWCGPAIALSSCLLALPKNVSSTRGAASPSLLLPRDFLFRTNSNSSDGNLLLSINNYIHHGFFLFHPLRFAAWNVSLYAR